MKKVKSILTAFVLICSLTACGIEKVESSQTTEEIVVTQTKYKEEQFSFSDDVNSVYKMGYVKDSGVRLIYSDKSNVFKFADYDENMQIKSSVVLFSAENIYNTRFNINNDGTISALIIYMKSNEEIGSENYYKNAEVTFEIRRFSADGKEESAVEIEKMSSYFDIESDFVEKFTEINGRYIISLFDRQLIVDENGKITDAQDIERNTYYCTDSNGEIITAGTKGYTYINDISPADSESMTAYGDYLNLQQGIATGYDGFKVFFMLNDGVFGLTETDNLIQIMDYNDSLMTCSDYYEVVYAGKGKFVAIGHNDGGNYLSVMNVRPDGYVMNREKVILGSTKTDSTEQELVTMFNKKSDSYTVELKNYDSFDDLKADILTGNPPDMYNFRDTADMCKLVNIGELADMYELSEKYGGFRKEDIMDNVIEAYEYKDGLYMMSQNFSISAIAGRKNVFPNPHMTYDEFFEIVNNAPENVYLTNAVDLTTKQEVFDYFCTQNLSQWIDYEKSECYFDTPDFINLLKFVDTVPILPRKEWNNSKNSDKEEQEIRQIYWQEENSRLKNGTALISTGISFSRPASILDIEQTTSFGTGLKLDELTIIYPFGKDSAGTIYGQGYYSIIANGNCPEGAWDYMNFLVSDNLLTSYLQTKSSFVTRKESFYKIFEKAQAISENPITIDANGVTHSYGYSRPITDEEIKTLMEYINGCSVVYGSYDDIAYIVSEEYSAYEAGESTAEQCAELIQNRVSIYLSENS
ncbi:MAG: extracellular solute-binding protein [Ruminococcus sp.]|nr:extracellular solute-binding protein [Ruminococcus sp.]